MAKKKKGRVYYKVVGHGYLLGYTSSKTAFTKEYVRNGWKAKDLKFTKMYAKT
tara:strand:- start:469 stop:627 length:159 start_codon:yes stop_codon:yes gene_type:complete